MSYAWLIEDDFLSDSAGYSAAGTTGPSNIDAGVRGQLDAGKGERFRIYDDDGVLYYAGRIVGDYDGFEPLDDYGTPNAGATSIEYEGPRGSWSVL